MTAGQSQTVTGGFMTKTEIHKSRFTGRQTDVDGQIYLEYRLPGTKERYGWVKDDGDGELRTLPANAIVVTANELAGDPKPAPAKQPIKNRNFWHRYLTVVINGFDIYSETLPTEGELKDFLPLLNRRITDAQEALPTAKFSGHIEQQWYEGYGTRKQHKYETLDLAGKTTESTY
jgi:hypothetical protein